MVQFQIENLCAGTFLNSFQVPNICAAYKKNMQVIEKKVSFIVERKMFLIKEVENTSNNQLITVVKK